MRARYTLLGSGQHSRRDWVHQGPGKEGGRRNLLKGRILDDSTHRQGYREVQQYGARVEVCEGEIRSVDTVKNRRDNRN
jgi:hypothetical protein